MLYVCGGSLSFIFLLCHKPPKYSVAPDNLLYLSWFFKLSAQFSGSCWASLMWCAWDCSHLRAGVMSKMDYLSAWKLTLAIVWQLSWGH